jgi:uncharacterized membrane protein
MHLKRYDGVDALRGLAMVWMTGFHLCFDLANQRIIQQNFYSDPFWTWQRTCILGLFLLCAGMGQAIAIEQEQSTQRFVRRWLQIAGCAALVTAGSILMFPKSFIYFGVLHGMAVMLIVVRLTAGWGLWLWPLGAIAIALKFVAAWAIAAGLLGSFFNTMAFNWLGLVSVNPITEDYVPVIPWLGVMWWGMAGMQWWLRHSRTQSPSSPLHTGLRPMAVLGRWSLTYYMLHQPVMLGVLGVLVWWRA